MLFLAASHKPGNRDCQYITLTGTAKAPQRRRRRRRRRGTTVLKVEHDCSAALPAALIAFRRRQQQPGRRSSQLSLNDRLHVDASCMNGSRVSATDGAKEATVTSEMTATAALRQFTRSAAAADFNDANIAKFPLIAALTILFVVQTALLCRLYLLLLQHPRALSLFVRLL